VAASTAGGVDPTAAYAEPNHLACSEVLRRDRLPGPGGDGVTALGYGVHRALYPAAAASVTVSQNGC